MEELVLKVLKNKSVDILGGMLAGLLGVPISLHIHYT